MDLGLHQKRILLPIAILLSIVVALIGYYIVRFYHTVLSVLVFSLSVTLIPFVLIAAAIYFQNI
jgi:hypothetical protein